MKKRVLSVLIGLSFALTLIPNVSATSNAIVSETVKIVGYHLTPNNHVIEQALASATIISKDGFLLTNYHVVTDENDEPFDAFAVCLVEQENKKPRCLYTATLIAREKSFDTAILKINPMDLEEKAIPLFPFLSFQVNAMPPVGEKIEIIGFPEIGGETITKTKGQISGYDESGEIVSLKTDAVISAGNSGGTAKNAEGDFIGIPTYLRSNITSIGYITPLYAIQDWLKKTIALPVSQNDFANDLLRQVLKQKDLVENNNLYLSSVFPFLKVGLTPEWKTEFMNETNLMISRTYQGSPLSINLTVDVLPFEVKTIFLNHLVQKVEKYQRYYTNYQRKETEFKGKKGTLITYDMGDYRNVYFMMPYENVIFSYSYQLMIADSLSMQAKVDEILENIDFVDKKNNTKVYQQNYQQVSPAIKLNTTEDFYVAPVYDSQNDETILNIYNPNSFEQVFEISQENIKTDLWDLPIEKLLEEEIKQKKWTASAFQLINKSAEILVDGLKGYAFTFSEQGDDFNQIKKQTEIVLILGKKSFRFIYGDLADNYDKNIGKMLKVINSFQYEGTENQTEKGVYNLPLLKDRYGDLLNYIYEKEINTLLENQVLDFEGQYFFPENAMTRIKALESILKSKIFIEDGRNLEKTKSGLASAKEKKVFSDVDLQNNRYLNYALDQKIISLGDRFFPERTVTLAETLKILCETYELPVWNPPYWVTLKWYVPYMYKGRSLGLISSGMTFDTPLSRGEFATLLYDFLKIVGEREDL